MNNNDPADTPMARLIRIETKLSSYIEANNRAISKLHSFIEANNRAINKLGKKVDYLQQTLDDIYPLEEEQNAA